MSKHSEQMTFLNCHFDPKQTRENVKQFFEVDYPAAKRRAGQFRTNRTGISSPQITGMPGGSSASNGVEERLVNAIYCRQVVYATADAIKCCSRWSRAILTMLYLDGYSDAECIDQLPFGDSSYNHKYKPEALIEFAEAYPLEELLAEK